MLTDDFWKKSLWAQGRELGLSRSETLAWCLRLKRNEFYHWWNYQIRLTRRAWSGSSGWKRVMIACWSMFLVASALSLAMVSVAMFVVAFGALIAVAGAYNAYDGTLEQEAEQRQFTRAYLAGLVRRDVQ